MNYQKLRSGVKQAGQDLLELGRGLEQAIMTKDLATAKQAGSAYLATPYASYTAAAVPLTTAAAAMNTIDAAQDDISATEASSIANTARAYAAGAGVAAGLASPVVATFIKRGEYNLAANEMARLQLELDRLGVTTEETENRYNDSVERAANAAEDATVPGAATDPAKARERAERAHQLKSEAIPKAQRRLNGIRNQRRAMGAGMTAAGLSLGGLALAMVDRTPNSRAAEESPEVYLPYEPEPYDKENVPPYVSPKSWAGYYPGYEYGL